MPLVHGHRREEEAGRHRGMQVGPGWNVTGSWHGIHGVPHGPRDREVDLGGSISVVGVPTSLTTRELAMSVGIPLVSLSEVGVLDLVIDGTDEFDPEFSLIKGGGGALTREKIVAQSSNAMIVVADERKQVDVLGKFHLPVEVLQFEWEATREACCLLYVQGRSLSGGERPSRHRQRGFILDCNFGESITNPKSLESEILSIGVVEVGLFCDMCDVVILAGEGEVQTIVKEGGRLG